ncbi:epstein-Barr nuclear antigen 1 [Kutzneria sp. 744]|nr:epstein-Barr nuclear antigen 1 [Kutzneria sp. 744]
MFRGGTVTGLRMLAVVGVTAALAVSLLPGTAVAAGPQAASAGATFVSVTPKRLLDTRTSRKVGAEDYVRLDLKSVVPANTTAVVFNLTGTNPTDTTTVRATPTLAGDAAGASNLNLAPGETRANLVTVAIGRADWAGGVYLTNHTGSVDLIADLAGYYVDDNSGARYTSISPTRVRDTRNSGGPVGPNGTISVDLSNVLPSTAKAVTFNLTGVSPDAATVITAWPHGTTQPAVSNLNLVPGDIRPNLVTVAVGPDRVVDLNNLAGNVDLVVDVAGYYATDRGDAYFTLSPTRATDSRTGPSFGPGESRAVDLTPWLPASAKAVVYNLTATNTTWSTFVTAYPAGTSVPDASNLNLVPGQTASNLAVTQLGAGGQLALRNAYGRVDLISDIAGYFGPAPAPCAGSCLYAFGRNDYGQLGDGTAPRTGPAASAKCPACRGQAGRRQHGRRLRAAPGRHGVVDRPHGRDERPQPAADAGPRPGQRRLHHRRPPRRLRRQGRRHSVAVGQHDDRVPGARPVGGHAGERQLGLAPRAAPRRLGVAVERPRQQPGPGATAGPVHRGRHGRRVLLRGSRRPHGVGVGLELRRRAGCGLHRVERQPAHAGRRAGLGDQGGGVPQPVDVRDQVGRHALGVGQRLPGRPGLPVGRPVHVQRAEAGAHTVQCGRRGRQRLELRARADRRRHGLGLGFAFLRRRPPHAGHAAHPESVQGARPGRAARQRHRRRRLPGLRGGQQLR